jgi:hypothetical protein
MAVTKRCGAEKLCGVLLAMFAWGMAAWAAYTGVRWTVALGWPAVPCFITESRGEQVRGEHPYAFRVAYRYTWFGREYVGRVVNEDYRGSSDVAEADRLIRAFPAGHQRRCFVNPRNPSESVLVHDNVWVPACLVFAMGLGGAFLLKAFCGTPRGLGFLSGVFLILMGLGGYAVFFAVPVWRGLRSRGWKATPCVVTSGEVRSTDHHSVVSVRACWPDIVFRYQVGGASYRSNNVNASDVGSPWWYGARRVVRCYPPGSAAVCFVNPFDPSEAVLDRSLSGTQWFGVWPLTMAGLGAVGVMGRTRQIGAPRLWGTLALWAATTVTLTVLWVTVSDLVGDLHDGTSEPAEIVAVLLAFFVSGGLLTAWAILAARSRHQKTSGTGSTAVYDRDTDHWDKAK